MVTAMSAAPAPRLVVFDLCDTLYNENTTVGFVRHFHKLHDNRRIERVLRRWSSKSSPLFYLGALAHRLFGTDLARQRIIASLAGESRVSLTETAAHYAQNVLPTRANQPLHDRLQVHRAAGDHVVLLSSSLDIVVSAVAAKLDIEYCASKLAFDGEICSGRLECDLTGRKAVAVRNLIDAAPETLVYTDNRSDKDLIAAADRATIVIPLGARDDQWGGTDCEYLRL